jgi:hypothetical protein
MVQLSVVAVTYAGIVLLVQVSAKAEAWEGVVSGNNVRIEAVQESERLFFIANVGDTQARLSCSSEYNELAYVYFCTDGQDHVVQPLSGYYNLVYSAGDREYACSASATGSPMYCRVRLEGAAEYGQEFKLEFVS